MRPWPARELQSSKKPKLFCTSKAFWRARTCSLSMRKSGRMSGWNKYSMCTPTGLTTTYGRRIAKREHLPWSSSIAKICCSWTRTSLRNLISSGTALSKWKWTKCLIPTPNKMPPSCETFTISTPIGLSISPTSSRWKSTTLHKFRMPSSLSIRSQPEFCLLWNFPPI